MNTTKRKTSMSLFVLAHIWRDQHWILCTYEYRKVRKFVQICVRMYIQCVYMCAWIRVRICINMSDVHEIQVSRGMNKPFFTTWHMAVIWTIVWSWSEMNCRWYCCQHPTGFPLSVGETGRITKALYHRCWKAHRVLVIVMSFRSEFRVFIKTGTELEDSIKDRQILVTGCLNHHQVSVAKMPHKIGLFCKRVSARPTSRQAPKVRQKMGKTQQRQCAR